MRDVLGWIGRRLIDSFICRWYDSSSALVVCVFCVLCFNTRSHENGVNDILAPVTYNIATAKTFMSKCQPPNSHGKTR